MDNPAEYFRGYVLREGINLSQEQFDAAYDAFISNCITDFESVRSRSVELFVARRFGRRDSKRRMRYFYICSICHDENTSDRHKWHIHVRTHFTEHHAVLMDVYYQLLYNA